MLLPSSFVSSASRLAAPVATGGFSTPLFSMSNSGDAALWIVRGGGEFFARKASSLDISRVRMRLEGLMAYATLCALLANGCLRLYSAVKLPKREQEMADKTKRTAYDAFYLFIVISILSGSYTTVVFTLLALYSKTALGRGYDAQFLEFWAATAGLRESGFEAFLYSLVCFELAFILSLFLRTEGRRRKILVLLACTISLFSFSNWYRIMRLAAQFLFPLRAEIEY